MAKRAKKPLKMPETTTPITRFVFMHTQGKFAGGCRIISLTPEMRKIVKQDGPPTFLPMQNFFDHNNGASLIRVKDGAAYYREVMPPPATGRLGEFHPQQQ